MKCGIWLGLLCISNVEVYKCRECISQDVSNEVFRATDY
jgi:hypothetical protein